MLKLLSNQIAWCSTRTDPSGKHVRGNYGNCWCREALGRLRTKIVIPYGTSQTSMCEYQGLAGVTPIPRSGTYLPTRPEECSNRNSGFILGTASENNFNLPQSNLRLGTEMNVFSFVC